MVTASSSTQMVTNTRDTGKEIKQTEWVSSHILMGPTTMEAGETISNMDKGWSIAFKEINTKEFFTRDINMDMESIYGLRGRSMLVNGKKIPYKEKENTPGQTGNTMRGNGQTI